MFYVSLKRFISVCFNILNWLLAGNLPPFGCIYILVEEQDHYLAIENPTGHFTFPGGFMRWSEHPVQAAQREGKEETGLDLKIGGVVGYYSNPKRRFNCINCLTIIFQAEVVGGELRSSVEGRPCWLDELEVRTKMSSIYQSMLDEYLNQRSERPKLMVSNSST